MALAGAQQAAAGNNEARLRRADAYARSGKLQAARLLYEQALAAGASLDGSYERSRALGEAYYKAKPPEYDAAAKWLQNAWRLRQATEYFRTEVADALWHAGRCQDAVLHYAALSAKHRNSADYTIRWASCLYRTGSQDKGLQVLRDFVGQHPKDDGARTEYGNLLARSKQYDEARLQYQAALKSHPKSVGAELGLARVNSWTKDFDASLKGFDAVLAQEPSNFEAQVGKASTLLWMGRDAEAGMLFTKLAKDHADDASVQRGLEIIQLRKERAERAAATPAPAQPTKENPVRSLMAEAERSISQGDDAQAMHYYHEVLEVDPTNADARMQVALILSRNKDYSESANQFKKVVEQHPGYLEAQVQAARVLSWGRDFENSANEYEKALAMAETKQSEGSKPSVDPQTIRLEYARVLAWEDKDQQSLQELNKLLPGDSGAMTASDVPVLIAKAKIYVSMHDYPNALANYSKAIALDPSNSEARVGKGQILYWTGHLDDAAQTLRPVVQAHPTNTDANTTLASIERGLGHNGRALRILETNTSSEGVSLREKIRTEIRPVLSMRFGYEDDRESIPSLDRGSTVRNLHYTTSLEFNVHPDVRMWVTNTFGQADASVNRPGFNRDALGSQTMLGMAFRPTRWLIMNVAGGAGTVGAGIINGTETERKTELVYSLHPIVVRGNFRLDVSAGRSIGDYTPLSIENGVMNRRESISASYNWRKRLRFGADYYHSNYSLTTPDTRTFFETAANGGSVYIMPTLVRTEKAIVEVGMSYDVYGYEDTALTLQHALGSGGFFAPRLYQSYGPTGHVMWMPVPQLQLDFNAEIGPKRYFLFDQAPGTADFSWNGNAGVNATFKLGRFQPFLGYKWSSSETPSAINLQALPIRGNLYRVNSFVVGFSYRF